MFIWNKCWRNKTLFGHKIFQNHKYILCKIICKIWTTKKRVKEAFMWCWYLGSTLVQHGGVVSFDNSFRVEMVWHRQVSIFKGWRTKEKRAFFNLGNLLVAQLIGYPFWSTHSLFVSATLEKRLVGWKKFDLRDVCNWFACVALCYCYQSLKLTLAHFVWRSLIH